jgi:hypothetical protein
LAAVATALFVAGCTAGPTTSAATPATAAATPPAVASLTVSPSGIGDLAIGEPVTAFDLVTYGQHTCPTKGGWLPRYPEAADTSSGQPLHPFDIDTQGGRATTAITHEYVWSNHIATARGIRVGSTLAAVEAAYPTATKGKSYTTSLFTVDGTHGRLIIEVAGDNDDAAGEWPAAELDTVVWMQVVPSGAAVESIAGNNDAGPCPVKGHAPDLDDD